MFNKFKRAVTYIYKKIKQGVSIMAEVRKELVSAGKDIANTVWCKAVDRIADHADKKLDIVDKKLDIVERAGTAIHTDIKSLGSLVCNGTKNTGSALCKGVKNVGTSLYNGARDIGTVTYNVIKNNKMPVAVLLIGVAGSLVCSEICNK